VGIDAARSGDGSAGRPEGAEQVPAALADVPEADEADPAVAQCLRLFDRVVVHRRRPHVAPQRPVLDKEFSRQHDRGDQYVLGDRPFVIEHVGHQHVWRDRIEVDAVGPGADHMNQAQLLGDGCHLGGEPPSDEDLRVAQLVDDGDGLANQPTTWASGSRAALKRHRLRRRLRHDRPR
jgi:hypothetical protein